MCKYHALRVHMPVIKRYITGYEEHSNLCEYMDKSLKNIVIHSQNKNNDNHFDDSSPRIYI